MKKFRIYYKVARDAEKVYIRLLQVLQDSLKEKPKNDILSLDYEDIQAMMRVLEYEHKYSRDSIRKRTRRLFESIVKALRDDYENGAQGHILLSSQVISEIKATLEIFYPL